MHYYPYYIFYISWFLIFYTYIIFPISIFILARILKSRKADSVASINEAEQLPRVCMVVASYNEAAVLQDKLTNTWELDYPAERFRLVIGSDGSTDASAEILSGCQDPRLIRHLFTERRGKISVLNALVNSISDSDAEILVFSDANTMFAPDALKKLVRHFADPNVGCVSGELKLEKKGGVSGEGFYWRYENWIKQSESALGFLIGCNGGIFALRREVYEPLPPNTIVEDFVLTMRILEKGWKVLFEPGAVGVEPPCLSSQAEMVRKIRIGAGNFQALFLTHKLLLPWYGLRAFAYWGHKVIRWLVPVFLISAFIANLFLLHNIAFVILFALQLIGLSAALWSYFSVEQRPAPKLIRLFGYFYLMNYAIFCGLLRFLRGNQRVTWERASR
jgi:cellulose synthase/poly-beta-1,6-N-acetylglucosamine synthase-like glycosyltransferase